MTTPGPNPYATAARVAKAEKLATAAETAGVSANALRAAPDAAWTVLAALADCNHPSEETKALVLAAMHQRQIIRSRIASLSAEVVFEPLSELRGELN